MRNIPQLVDTGIGIRVQLTESNVMTGTCLISENELENMSYVDG